MIVDEMHEEHPELLKDQYWEEVVPTELPYTVASEHYRRFEPKGSAETYKIKAADAMYANIIPSKRQNFDDYADYVRKCALIYMKNQWNNQLISIAQFFEYRRVSIHRWLNEEKAQIGLVVK